MSDIVQLRQPIGSNEENATGAVWCGGYFDATGYARRYRIGSKYEAYHPGADLNCNLPGHFDKDKLAPVYAICDGVVLTAQRYADWGNIIVIEHYLENGALLYARYAHVDNLDQVVVGKPVKYGDVIARIGNAFGTMAYHLHFDLSFTDVLKRKPNDWPKLNLKRLLLDYADPKLVIQARSTPANVTIKRLQVTATTLFIRSAPNTIAQIVGKLKKDQIVDVINTEPVRNVYNWQRLADADLTAPPRWIATDYTRYA